jgi:hypothetical protein
MKLSSMTVEGPIEVRSCKELLTKSKDHKKKSVARCSLALASKCLSTERRPSASLQWVGAL